jgi:hypothetical protein
MMLVCFVRNRIVSRKHSVKAIAVYANRAGEKGACRGVGDRPS